MIRPDFRDFRKRSRILLSHSAKGSEWEDHKYIKRIDGTYYYPDSYEGGRHISDLSDSNKNNKEKEGTEDNNLSDYDVDALAKEVIRGNFGNGQTRKELLGDNYQEIQNKVNELMKSSKKISEVSSEEVKVGKEATKKATEKVTQASKGLNLDQVYSVYRKKK